MISENPPLNGLRVLDLGRYQAGPRCGLMFARMGAEVIKVEALQGDESRRNGPKVRGQSAYWVQYNSGKKSLAINLRLSKAKDILRDLARVSDVFLQNYRPGTIESMGFGYDVLQALNPRIVMVNVSAYGQDGPYHDRIGFDPIGQAMGGLMSLTGFPDGPPIRTYFPLIDRITALHGTIGAMAALMEREKSGVGQSIDVSLADTGFTVNEIPLAAHLGSGEVTNREGNGKGLSNSYQTSNGWVFIHANNDTMWRRVCDALDKPEWLTRLGFATADGRERNASELETTLSSWFKTRTTASAVEYLSSYSIPCAPINDVRQAAAEPLLHERELLVEVPDQTAGTIHVAGKMIKFGRTSMVVDSAPTVGEHTRYVLGNILGYSDQKIQDLVNSEVVTTGEDATIHES